MNEMMTIENREIQVKEWNGRRVVTFKDIDRVHQRNEGTAKWNFNHNKQHFIDGEDFFAISRKEFGVNFTPNEKLIGNPNVSMLLITESGYLMLVKSFTDELAWKVQRQLVNCYFRIKEEMTMTITESEALTKREYLQILSYLSKITIEALPLAKQIIEKIAPGEFENMKPIIPQTKTTATLQLPSNFGEQLKNALIANGMSQSQFAEKIQCSKSGVSQYVNGKVKPREEILSKIVNVLNINFGN